MYISRPEVLLTLFVELCTSPHMGDKGRSRGFEALLIKAHISWTDRALYERTGGIVHDDIGVEEDVLDSLERAFNQESQ